MILFILIWPSFVFAGEANLTEAVFEAKVTKILQEKELTREDGSVVTQQNLELEGLSGGWLKKKIVSEGIDDIDVVKSVKVELGDKVLITASVNADGQPVYYVTDFVRRGWLYFLTFIFVACAVLVGRGKGLKALISLFATFLVIMWFIIPRILNGHGPLSASIIGSIIILTVIIYITWGFKRKSHIAVVSIFISLILTGLISILFTKLTGLTGLAQEEAMFLIGLSKEAINFHGLLLAGIIIGTLGVLDDVVISQISAIEQLKQANPGLTVRELFGRGLKIGVDHISSMINTLFLAYAGASLPLLLLFGVKAEPFVSFSQVINNELIATEIVRTLTGSIGLILAVPIATILAARFLGKRANKVNPVPMVKPSRILDQL